MNFTARTLGRAMGTSGRIQPRIGPITAPDPWQGPSGLEFVDANVLVYAEDTSAGAKRDRALELVSRLWEERRGCLSVQVLQEFFVTVTRKVAKPLAEEAAEQRVRDLALWTCFSPTASDVVAAIGLSRAHRLSFWDAMIVESAAQLGKVVLTMDG